MQTAIRLWLLSVRPRDTGDGALKSVAEIPPAAAAGYLRGNVAAEPELPERVRVQLGVVEDALERAGAMVGEVYATWAETEDAEARAEVVRALVRGWRGERRKGASAPEPDPPPIDPYSYGDAARAPQPTPRATRDARAPGARRAMAETGALAVATAPATEKGREVAAQPCKRSVGPAAGNVADRRTHGRHMDTLTFSISDLAAVCADAVAALAVVGA